MHSSHTTSNLQLTVGYPILIEHSTNYIRLRIIIWATFTFLPKYMVQLLELQNTHFNYETKFGIVHGPKAVSSTPFTTAQVLYSTIYCKNLQVMRTHESLVDIAQASQANEW